MTATRMIKINSNQPLHKRGRPHMTAPLQILVLQCLRNGLVQELIPLPTGKTLEIWFIDISVENGTLESTRH